MTLNDEEFERHAEQSVHFFSRRVPAPLRAALLDLSSGARVVDVGCGDGQLVWALLDTGVLPSDADVLGVDLSPTRVRRFREMTGRPALLGDGEALEVVPDATADFCVSTMVMEHVRDDASYASSLARITRPGGGLYLTTVLRKRGAWYFRKAPDGRRVLDPTHVREYADVETVRRIVERAGFCIESCHVVRLVFPVIHPFIRWWNALRPIRDVQRLFLVQPWSLLERVALPIPRYFEIQVVARRLGGSN